MKTEPSGGFWCAMGVLGFVLFYCLTAVVVPPLALMFGWLWLGVQVLLCLVGVFWSIKDLNNTRRQPQAATAAHVRSAWAGLAICGAALLLPLLMSLLFGPRGR